ncbi:MAG: hypothetical protein ACK5YU_01480 [Burkholderiales bacterium]|jgi:hypothetical protein
MDRHQILNPIRESFLSLGYESFSSSLTFDRRDVWMRRINDPASGNFATTIYLEYKPNFKAYSVAFGVVEDDLVRQLRQLLSLTKIQELLYGWKSARLHDSPCWNLFDAGRALNWRYLCIPDPDAPADWQTEFQKLQETVLDGIAHKVVNAMAYSRFLLRSDAPFEWWTSCPVLRAGQIVLALMRQGYSVEATVSELEEHRTQIENAIGNGSDLSQFVRAISTYAK